MLGTHRRARGMQMSSVDPPRNGEILEEAPHVLALNNSMVINPKTTFE